MNIKITKNLCLALSLLLLFSACQKQVETPQVTEATQSITSSMYGVYDEEDLDPNWDATAAKTITLADNATTTDEDTIDITNNTITIKQSGIYVITGTLTNGQLLVNTAESDQETVRLILQGVTITNEKTSPIYVEQAEKTIITLVKDTVNTVTDGTTYQYADATQDESDAPIFSKDDLTINGSGTLNVQANYNNGIRSKDDLVITGGIITVTAPNNALKAKDSLSILEGTLTLTAKGDAIQVNNSEDATKGWIGIDGGNFTLTSGNDAIQAESALKIGDGTFSIQTGVNTSSEDTEPSTKGLKSSNEILISGGKFTIDAVDDGVHSNNSITITGGDLTIRTGDDGVHADQLLDISAGTITVTDSYEGLEAAVIQISGGTIDVTAQDDGINVAGGDGGEGGFGGQNLGDYQLIISGGDITVHAEGDGIDSNNMIEQSDGTVTVYGPSTGGNGALDYDGSYTLTSGTLLAAGVQDMAVAPDSSSTQPSISLYLNNTLQSGSTIELKTEDGSETLAHFTAEKTMGHLVISTPEMKENNTYTLYVNGEQTSTITLSEMTTTISEDGTAVSARGMGGGFGGGRR